MDPVARALAHESYERKRLAEQIPSVTVDLATTDALLVDDLQDWHGLPDCLESSDDYRGTARGGSDRLTAFQQLQVPAVAKPQLPVEMPPEKTVGVTKGAWRAKKEALAELPKLQQVPCNFFEVDRFLLEIEAFARRYESTSELLEIAESQIHAVVLYFFSRRMKVMYPESDRDYKTLAKVMSKLSCFRDPAALLNYHLDKIDMGQLQAVELYLKLGSVYDTYVRFCERTESPVDITEDSLASKYMSLLPSELRDRTTAVVQSLGNPGFLRCVEIAVGATQIQEPKTRRCRYCSSYY